jgi:hypothetical protein
MAFELTSPRQRQTGIQRGEISLNANGLVTYNKVDLTAVGFVQNALDKAAVLIDKATRRIAIRVVKEGEPFAKLKYNTGNTAASINMKGTLKALGITSSKPRRYAATIKDDLLIFQL